MTDRQLQQCPKCRSQNIQRSRAKTRWESWRKMITGRRPFRCRACGWRGWAVDGGPVFDARAIELAARAVAPASGNLARTEKSRDVDLKHLDSFETTGEKPR